MDVLSHINRARRLGYITAEQYPNSDAIVDLNVVYHDIEDKIVKLQEDFFWDFFVDDTVVGQSEYLIPTIMQEAGQYFLATNKVTNVALKYKEDQEYYTNATLTDIKNLPYNVDWYAKNQSIVQPLYHISDNSYFVYPAPTEAVENGIKTTVIRSLRDLTLNDTEEAIFGGKIAQKYHNLIDLGMLEYVFRQRGMLNEANEAKNRYDIESINTLKRLVRRYNGPVQVTDINLSHYA